ESAGPRSIIRQQKLCPPGRTRVFPGAHDGKKVVEGLDLQVSRGGVPPEVERGQPRVAGAAEILGESVAHVKDGGGGAAEQSEGLLEHDPGRLGEARFTRDHDAVEVSAEAEFLEKRAQ